MPFFIRVPFLHVKAITLWFIVLWKYTYKPDGTKVGLPEQVAHHETIHFRQYNETWVIGFIVLYFYDWIRAYWEMREGLTFMQAVWAGYYMIRFEQEAYANDGDKDYLNKRKKNAWKEFSL